MEKEPKSTAAQRVAQNLRRVRQRRGYTLAQLSDRLDANGHRIGLGMLSKMELGQRGVTVDDLDALAQALEVRVEKLLEQADEEAFVRVAKMVDGIGQIDFDIFAAEQEQIQLAEKLRKLQELRVICIERLAEEVVHDGDLIEQVPGPVAARVLDVAKRIADGTINGLAEGRVFDEIAQIADGTIGPSAPKLSPSSRRDLQ